MNARKYERGFRMKKKSRWKDLPFYERLAKELKRNGLSDEMCEHVRKRGERKENLLK